MLLKILLHGQSGKLFQFCLGITGKADRFGSLREQPLWLTGCLCERRTCATVDDLGCLGKHEVEESQRVELFSHYLDSTIMHDWCLLVLCGTWTKLFVWLSSICLSELPFIFFL